MTENRQWIEEFIKQKGRPPRILHIGNIANNAYQNAKMLNQAGCDCDVLCYDYYHCMGCPEWDDADYEGDIGDPFFPAWHKVRLNGFERPRWFAQAPMSLAVKYLIARRDKKTAKSDRLWKKMNRVRRYFATAHSNYYRDTAVFYKAHYYLMRTMHGGAYYARLAIKATVLLLTDYCQFKYKLKKTLLARTKKNADKTVLPDQPIRPDIIDTYNMAVEDFKRLFPERESRIERHLASYIASARAILPLLERYDIVEAYAHCPILPYLAGYENYIAFEHGTIRDFPVNDDPVEQLAMLAFANAKAIYLTNIDCVPSAEYIIRNHKVPLVYGLHGLNVERIISLQDMAKEYNAMPVFTGKGKAAVFFCPSRHTFDKSKKVFLKSEDMAIRAAARLRREGFDFKLVMVDWGDDVKMINDIIAALPELAGCVAWIKPLKKLELYKAYQLVDAVIDQFYWKGFGGIDFEVLCTSSAALISSKPDPDCLARFFLEPPPYYACETEDEIADAMRQIINDPVKARLLAKKGANWIRSWHSDKMILLKNFEAYAYCNTRNLERM
jgi:hypothetical protein